jgi:predicted class III extradiol MEMO1 family dioxygenase
VRLSRTASPPATLAAFPIHESISALDHEAMELLAMPPNNPASAHTYFADYLARTKNTICGRHPIGVLLGVLAARQDGGGATPKFAWVRYEQSSACVSAKDSSVSYASAYIAC